MTSSSDPYWVIHLAAVLGPTLSTPGTLSTVSPVRLRKSTMRSGGTPKRSTTPAASRGTAGEPSRVMVLTRTVSSATSCARSLSPVETTVFMPARRACATSVPMTSSASIPGMTSSGQPSATEISWIGLICMPQVIGHHRAVRLVLVVHGVAEGLARRIEDDRPVQGAVVQAGILAQTA